LVLNNEAQGIKDICGVISAAILPTLLPFSLPVDDTFEEVRRMLKIGVQRFTIRIHMPLIM
jgi:hypothetical protein